MKVLKKIGIVVAVVSIIAASAIHVAAETPQHPRIRIDGEFIQFAGEQPPAIINGRTLAPVRDVMEALGFEVEWTPPNDNHNGEVMLTRHDWRREAANRSGFALIEIDSDMVLYRLPDAQVPNVTMLDVPAQIVNGRTMIPVRAIAELTGYIVTWDGVNFIVDINTSQYSRTLTTLPGIQDYETTETPDSNNSIQNS